MADPCEFEVNLRFLRLTDPQSRESVTSAAATPLTRPNTAFVLTADPRSGVGSYSVVDLATRNVTRDIRRGGVHSDALARSFGGRVYVVNRPTTNTVDPSISITEASLGGDITDFEIVSSTKGFAIVTDANFANSLVTFNPSTAQRLTTVLGPLDVFIPHLAVNSRNELYVAVRDLRTTTPGVRVFDTVTDRDLIPGPLNVGQLPPIWILFLE